MRALGYSEIEQRFGEAMMANKLHHAWLLHGIKGIGKRLLAENLAGLLMCETHSACGTCHACLMLAAGSHPDVHAVELLDGKRDINIEQIRGVLEFLSLSGAESERRVVIVDDAERMNMQAANALLKGLEEPAAGSLVLIVCADVNRLPATIRSRCMLQNCPPLSDEAVRQVLTDMEIDDAFIDLAVRLAEGAPGRVECMQQREIAQALQQWQELISDISQADIGELEAWIRQHVSQVPHGLITRLLAMQAYSDLTQRDGGRSYAVKEKLYKAMHTCASWPSDVIQRGLRPAPSLLANVLQLRTALRAVNT